MWFSCSIGIRAMTLMPATVMPMPMTIIISSSENPRIFLEVIDLEVIDLFRGRRNVQLANCHALLLPVRHANHGAGSQLPRPQQDGLAFFHRVIGHRRNKSRCRQSTTGQYLRVGLLGGVVVTLVTD